MISLLSVAYSNSLVDPTIAARNAAAEIRNYQYPDEVDRLAAKSLVKLAAWQKKYDSKNTCTVATAIKRKEWFVSSCPTSITKIRY
jgi:hypothetical protein